MKKLFLISLLFIMLCVLNSCGSLDATLYNTEYQPYTVVYYKPYSFYKPGVGFLHRYPPYPTYYKQVLSPPKKHHNPNRKGGGRSHRH